MQHCPKRHLDFVSVIDNPNKVNTYERINGAKIYNEVSTETGTIGTGTNPADALAKIGSKKKNLEAEVSDKQHLNG